LGNGRDKSIAYLAEHPSIAQEIRVTLVEGAKAECQMAPAAATTPQLPPGALSGSGANGHAQA
jgi:hypothetical protein